MYTPIELLDMVNGAIEKLPYDRKPQSLYAPIRYVLSLGGKRIRPVLMLLAYNLYREDVQSILTQAVAIETYHNYTLLHDDLMDNADMRRGHLTVHKKWDANTAILSGDSMLVMAYQRMENCAPEKLGAVLGLFTETALEIGEGQQYDMDFERRSDVTVKEYVEMIRLKTSVLLACALKIGAILGDAPKDDADNLYRFGERIGLAFQLQDDLLDVYGDANVFGKRIGGDIASNKKTFLLIQAFNNADGRQRAELNRWISAERFDRDEKVKAVRGIYDEIGVKGMCLELINSYYEESRLFLQNVALPDDRKVHLRDFALSMLNRSY